MRTGSGNWSINAGATMIVPTLVEYIKIPNKSPSFDPQWDEHGYMDDAVRLFEGWARERITALPGATLEIVRLPGRTPLMLIEVPASGAGNECRYGAALRPSRQAAGDGRLGRGVRAVDAAASTATGSTAAAAPTTATRCSGR